MTEDEIAINLRAIIAENLSSPGGDPMEENLSAAAIAFLTLEGMGKLDADTRGYERNLTGENICGENFLERTTAYGGGQIVNPRVP